MASPSQQKMRMHPFCCLCWRGEHVLCSEFLYPIKRLAVNDKQSKPHTQLMRSDRTFSGKDTKNLSMLDQQSPAHARNSGIAVHLHLVEPHGCPREPWMAHSQQPLNDDCQWSSLCQLVVSSLGLRRPPLHWKHQSLLSQNCRWTDVAMGSGLSHGQRKHHPQLRLGCVCNTSHQPLIHQASRRRNFRPITVST